LNSQCLLYLFKRFFCLLEEAKYNRRAEFTIAWLVHFEDLLECSHIDVVTEIDIVTLGLGLLATVLEPIRSQDQAHLLLGWRHFGCSIRLFSWDKRIG